MSLQPGYNIVTERVADTDNELSALEFFRKIAADEDVEPPVTVTRLEDLLYHVDEQERSEVLQSLRQTMWKSRSLSSMDAVQFVVEGRLVDDVEFRVRIERTEGGVYLDVGQMFVEEPQSVSAAQFVARK